MTPGLTDELSTALPEFDEPQDAAEILAGDDAPENRKREPFATSFLDAPKRVFYDWSKVQMATKLIRTLPKPGETLHCIVNDSFSGGDLVPAIQKLQGQPVRELILTTLGFSTKNIDVLCDMFHKGLIQKMSLTLSAFFASNSTDAYLYAKRSFEEAKCPITVKRNHTKLQLYDFGRTFYTVESSANLRSCSNYEAFTLTNSKLLFDFHKQWVNKML